MRPRETKGEGEASLVRHALRAASIRPHRHRRHSAWHRHKEQLVATFLATRSFLSTTTMSTSNLADVRARLGQCWTSTRLDSLAVQTVSFQPKHTKVNQDRLVTEEWKIAGQKWLFLAVCDGKGVLV